MYYAEIPRLLNDPKYPSMLRKLINFIVLPSSFSFCIFLFTNQNAGGSAKLVNLFSPSNVTETLRYKPELLQGESSGKFSWEFLDTS